MGGSALRLPLWLELRLNDFATAQAGGADADALGRAFDLGVYRAQVHVPAPPGDVVGVADDISESRLLAADVTNLCHGLLQIGSEFQV